MSKSFLPRYVDTPGSVSARFLPPRVQDPRFVRIRVLRSSICNTDRRVMRSDKCHTLHSSTSIAIGHEGGGIRIDNNQKVVVLPHFHPSLPNSFKELPNLSPRMLHVGIHLSGLMTDIADIPESCLYPIGQNQIDDDAMALVEPTACALRCIVKLGHATKGEAPKRIAIWGGGPMGVLLALLAKRVFERVQVVIVEPNPIRRSVVAALDVADELIPIMNYAERVNVGIIASSSLEAYKDGLEATELGGIVMLFSGIDSHQLRWRNYPLATYLEDVHRSEADIDPMFPMTRGRRLIGSSGYTISEIARSVAELSSRFSYYQIVQNVVIDGLDSNVAKVKRPFPKELTFEEPAVVAFLAPSGINDQIHGRAIAESLKVLVRVCER